MFFDGGTRTSTLSIMIGSGSFPTNPANNLTPAAFNCGELTVGDNLRPRTRLAGAINGNFTGFISVGAIWRLQSTGGDITNSINATYTVPGIGFSGNRAIANIVVQNLVGQVSADNGMIERIDAVSVQRTVEATNGSIARIEATGSTGINLATGNQIRAKTGITTILAPVINATIIANSGNLLGGNIDRLEATAGGFSGSLQATSLTNTVPGTSGILVNGALSATVTLEGSAASRVQVQSSSSPVLVKGAVSAPVTATTGGFASLTVNGPLSSTLTVASSAAGSTIALPGGLPAAGSVRINGSHAGSLTIGTATTINLVGPVIFNGGNAGGTWTGSVTVGSTPLTPSPAYPISSALLGTGAVGLVPFQFYRQDCSPPQANASSSPMVRNSELPGGNYPAIRLRFYGPVAVPAGQSAINTIRVFQGVPPTALVEEETFNEADQGPEMTGSWTATLAAVPFNAGRQELRLSYTGGTPAAGPYYITNMGSTAQLLCDLGLTPSPPIAGFTYRFTVTDIAAGCGSAFLDYNGDTVVDPDDIGDFITDYYTSPPIPGPGGYASPCAAAGNAAPPFAVEAYRNYGYKADFYKDDNACSAPPNSDDLGDYITAYFNFCV